MPRYLAVTLLASALLGGVATVIAAWTPRRAYATATIIAVFIIPPIVVQLMASLPWAISPGCSCWPARATSSTG